MGFWIPLLLFVASTAISVIFRPRLPKATKTGPQPFELPTAEYGRPIPVIFGTEKIANPNILWAGDQAAGANSSSPSGWNYSMGAQYGICMSQDVGSISRLDLVDVLFNDISPPRTAIVVDNSNKQIKFGLTSPWIVASMATGTYANPEELAKAAQDAMNAASGTNDYRVHYGFDLHPVQGGTTPFRYVVRFGGVDYIYTNLAVFPKRYTGPELADTLERAFAKSQADIAHQPGGPYGTFAISYNAVSGAFTITFTPTAGGYNSWTIKGGSATTDELNRFLGFRWDIDTTTAANPGILTGASGQKEHLFWFTYRGATASLRLTDAAFTSAASLFNLSTGADQTILAYASSVATFSGASYDSPPLGSDGVLIQRCLEFAVGSIFGTDGGVSGRMDVQLFSSIGRDNWYLHSKIGAALPEWRSLVFAVMRGMFVGYQPYPKSIAFILRRAPEPLPGSSAPPIVGSDLNPAIIIYEVLINGDWGCRVPGALIDVPSFSAASTALSNENFGLSAKLEEPQTGRDFIEEVLRHIDGTLYVDPATGLTGLQLARNDYTVSALQSVNRSNIDAVVLTRPSWSETRNVVKIRYVDRAAGYIEKVEQLQDLANIQARGGEMAVEEFGFPMVRTQQGAKQICVRALRALSRPLAHIAVKGANRQFWAIHPGTVLRLTWAPLGITDMPIRVTRLESGQPGEGKINFEAIEDAFGAPWSSWVAPAA